VNPTMRRYRLTLHLWIILALVMAVCATGSALAVLYIQRPFVFGAQPRTAPVAGVLFSTAIVAGALAAVAGLLLGLRLTRRIWLIIERAEAAAPPAANTPNRPMLDELGVLDAAVGRLTLSVDRFVSDSDILTKLPEGMLLLGTDDSLISFNPAAETLLGAALERLRGRPLLSDDGVFPLEAGNGPLARLLAKARSDDHAVARCELAATTGTGRRLVLDLTAQDHDRGQSLVLLFRDATEKRRIREQIKRADQLALLGALAARVAHEVRTPLATIRGLIEFLQQDLEPDHRGREYVDKITGGLDRQERLVQKLLMLTHAAPLISESVSISLLLQDVVAALPGHRPTLALEHPVPPILGDSVLLAEVFSNLLTNAFEAGDGTVIVRAVATHGGTVQIDVTNYGVGIPIDLQERVFEPFFTTKPRGTGLGLAIARQVTEAHGGTIKLVSDGRAATTFVVELPRAETSAEVVAR